MREWTLRSVGGCKHAPCWAGVVSQSSPPPTPCPALAGPESRLLLRCGGHISATAMGRKALGFVRFNREP